jgi:hypothetical protein
MPCDEYKRLADVEKFERKQHSYFTFNKEIARVSDRKGRMLAKEAMAKSVEARKQMVMHRQYCEKCKNEPGENFVDPEPWK